MVKEAIYYASPRYVRIAIFALQHRISEHRRVDQRYPLCLKKRTYSAVRINVRYVRGTDIYRRKARQGLQSYASEGTKGGLIAFSI